MQRYKEDIVPGLGHDEYRVLTRNEGGRKYSYYIGFSKNISPERRARFTSGVIVEDMIYPDRDAALRAANELNERYEREGIYIYG